MPTKRAIMDVAGTRSSVSRRLICQAPGGPDPEARRDGGRRASRVGQASERFDLIGRVHGGADHVLGQRNFFVRHDTADPCGTASIQSRHEEHYRDFRAFATGQ